MMQSPLCSLFSIWCCLSLVVVIVVVVGRAVMKVIVWNSGKERGRERDLGGGYQVAFFLVGGCGGG